jgi:transmembrane sensor
MSSNRLLSEAADWIARLMSGVATADDRHGFAAWRAISPAHDAAGAQAMQIWMLAGEALRPSRAQPRALAHIGAGDDWRDENWSFLAQRAGQLHIQRGFFG